MGIENKNQPRPTAIVSATPTRHAPTPFPPPPSFAMFSITAPVKNQETSTRIQQIEAGYEHPTPPPPPPPPKPEPTQPRPTANPTPFNTGLVWGLTDAWERHQAADRQIFVENSLINDDVMFIDLMGQPDTPAENTNSREKVTTTGDWGRAKTDQREKIEEELQKDDPNEGYLEEMDGSIRFIEWKQAGGYQNMNPTPEQEQARKTYVGEYAALVHQYTNMKNLKGAWASWTRLTKVLVRR